MPVVLGCTGIPHKQRWQTGRDFAGVAEWDKQVARNNDALFLDLTRVIAEAYKKIGKETADTFFADKGTHTNDAGARFNARCIVAGLKSLPGDPLAEFLSAEGRAVEPFQGPDQPMKK